MHGRRLRRPIRSRYLEIYVIGLARPPHSNPDRPSNEIDSDTMALSIVHLD